MTHTFDSPIDRRNTSCLKWDKYQGRDVIPLWVADMDFASPPAVIDALRQRVEHGVFGYTLPPRQLVSTVQEMLQRDFGWSVNPQWIVWLPGMVSGLNVACRAVGSPGDAVHIFAPVYPPFFSAPRHMDRALVTHDLHNVNGRWTIDTAEFNSRLTARSRMLMLCNPHNPVGRVFDRDELTQLAEACCRHNMTICSDEIHCGLVLDEAKRHIPIATLSAEIAARTITLMAPSKTYNIAGLGCCFAVISEPELRHTFTRSMAGIVPDVNALGYAAALAAYRNGGEWLCDLLVYLRVNRDIVDASIRAMPGLSVSHVEATYLSWIDTRGAGLSNPVQFFESAGVGLSNGKDFGAPGFVRLNFGCPRSVLEEALRRMRGSAEWGMRNAELSA